MKEYRFEQRTDEDPAFGALFSKLHDLAERRVALRERQIKVGKQRRDFVEQSQFKELFSGLKESLAIRSRLLTGEEAPKQLGLPAPTTREEYEQQLYALIHSTQTDLENVEDIYKSISLMEKGSTGEGILSLLRHIEETMKGLRVDSERSTFAGMGKWFAAKQKAAQEDNMLLKTMEEAIDIQEEETADARVEADSLVRSLRANGGRLRGLYHQLVDLLRKLMMASVMIGDEPHERSEPQPQLVTFGELHTQLVQKRRQFMIMKQSLEAQVATLQNSLKKEERGRKKIVEVAAQQVASLEEERQKNQQLMTQLSASLMTTEREMSALRTETAEYRRRAELLAHERQNAEDRVRELDASNHATYSMLEAEKQRITDIMNERARVEEEQKELARRLDETGEYRNRLIHLLMQFDQQAKRGERLENIGRTDTDKSDSWDEVVVQTQNALDVYRRIQRERDQLQALRDKQQTQASELATRELQFQQQQAKQQHIIARLQQQLEHEKKQFAEQQLRAQQQRESDLIALAQEREQLHRRRYQRHENPSQSYTNLPTGDTFATPNTSEFGEHEAIPTNAEDLPPHETVDVVISEQAVEQEALGSADRVEKDVPDLEHSQHTEQEKQQQSDPLTPKQTESSPNSIAADSTTDKSPESTSSATASLVAVPVRRRPSQVSQQERVHVAEITFSASAKVPAPVTGRRPSIQRHALRLPTQDLVSQGDGQLSAREPHFAAESAEEYEKRWEIMLSGLNKPIPKKRVEHTDPQVHPLENAASGSLLAEIRRDVDLFRNRSREAERRAARLEKKKARAAWMTLGPSDEDRSPDSATDRSPLLRPDHSPPRQRYHSGSEAAAAVPEPPDLILEPVPAPITHRYYHELSADAATQDAFYGHNRKESPPRAHARQSMAAPAKGATKGRPVATAAIPVWSSINLGEQVSLPQDGRNRAMPPSGAGLRHRANDERLGMIIQSMTLNRGRGMDTRLRDGKGSSSSPERRFPSQPKERQQVDERSTIAAAIRRVLTEHHPSDSEPYRFSDDGDDYNSVYAQQAHVQPVTVSFSGSRRPQADSFASDPSTTSVSAAATTHTRLPQSSLVTTVIDGSDLHYGQTATSDNQRQRPSAPSWLSYLAVGQSRSARHSASSEAAAVPVPDASIAAQLPYAPQYAASNQHKSLPPQPLSPRELPPRLVDLLQQQQQAWLQAQSTGEVLTLSESDADATAAQSDSATAAAHTMHVVPMQLPPVASVYTSSSALRADVGASVRAMRLRSRSMEAVAQQGEQTVSATVPAVVGVNIAAAPRNTPAAFV